MRVHLIARGYQAADIDDAVAARRFLAWLADERNPALTEAIQAWLWRPADAGGLGALAGSPAGIRQLRDRVAAAFTGAFAGAGESR